MLKASIVGVTLAFMNAAFAQTCADDIAASVKNGVDVAVNVAKASADCAKADRSACSQDIDALLDGLDSQEKNIAQATGDCKGESPTCVAALKKIGDAIDDFKPIADKMVDECAGDHMSKFSCYLDGFRLLSSGATFAAALKNAVETCKAPSDTSALVDLDNAGTEISDAASAVLSERLVSLEGDIEAASPMQCLADVAVNAKDSVVVVSKLVTAASGCGKEGNFTNCTQDVTALLNALETQDTNIGQALGDCLAKSPQCVTATQKIIGQIEGVKSSIEEFSNGCLTFHSNKTSCIFGGVHLMDGAVTVAEAVMQAVQTCRKREIIV